ncbi:MAG: hypothetical protein FWD81_02475 [Methanomassiliicoccaceae archaeon]|nr:hypothetical protein [Methanomassiliicoccaceae archaeon]
MSKILDKWQSFKEIKGAEYALMELEKAMGVWLLTDHIRFILRMNDYESMTAVAGGDQ